MRLAFDYMKQAQLNSEETYSYLSGSGIDGYSCKTVTYWDDPLATPIMTVISSTEVMPDDAALAEAVASQPVSIGLCAGNLQFYESGVLTADGCCTDIDHGVLAVGYGVDTASSLPYFKVKNSWGIGWGEDGYVRLERVDDGVGACGMLQYSTAVEVGPPQCTSDVFCGGHGEAGEETGEDPMGWNCECTCEERAGRQCQWDCVQDTDCANSEKGPFCSSDGFCASSPTLPQGCIYVDGDGKESADVTTNVTCTGDIFCHTEPDDFQDVFTSLTRQEMSALNIYCSGFNEDNDWLLGLANGAALLTDLSELFTDVSFSPMGDVTADFAEIVLAGIPTLSKIGLEFTVMGIGDEELAALGKTLAKAQSLRDLWINLRLNDEDDGDVYITATGAGEFTESLSSSKSLKNIYLSFFQNPNIMAEGVMNVAAAMKMGFSELQTIYLNLDTTFPESTYEDGNDAVGALGSAIGVLSSSVSLESVILSLGGNHFDEPGQILLGEGLACAVDNGVTLPDFEETCACGLTFDAEANCLKLQYDSTDVYDCLICTLK